VAGSARRRDGQIAQERMLEEAMTAIAETGLATLTMSALAERLGTSGGHILYYFGSKDLLLLEALRWSEAELTQERRTLLARRLRVERKLDLFVELYLPRGPRDPRWMLWIELWPRAVADETLRKAQRELDQGWQEDLERLLGRGVAEGRFALSDREIPDRAEQLLALLDGLSTRILLEHGETSRGKVLAAARAAAALLVPRT
jgi:AcrR family transcriptional regulator